MTLSRYWRHRVLRHHGIQDLLGGQISAMSSPVGDYLPYLKTGRLRLLAISGKGLRPGAHKLALAVGLFGASLLFGDGIITPAISVLSAVEGLGVATPALEPAILPIASVILFLLFSAQ